MKDIILASKSIDRSEILKKAKIPFKIIIPTINEQKFKEKISDPIKLVKELARAKALDVKKKVKQSKNDSIIIAADTLIEFKRKIIGKANDKNEAFEILELLNNKSHKLITGIAVTETNSSKIIVDYSKTSVEFLNLSENEIWNYIKTEEWMGRAGAYSIKDMATLFIRTIKGSPSNVIGLPMHKIFEILKKEFNFNLFFAYK